MAIDYIKPDSSKFYAGFLDFRDAFDTYAARSYDSPPRLHRHSGRCPLNIFHPGHLWQHPNGPNSEENRD